MPYTTFKPTILNQKKTIMKMTRLLMAVAISVTLGFMGCSPKDTEIQAAVETKLKAEPDMSTVNVDVKDGVATIAGECKDEACKANCEQLAKDVKGVKTVINNLTVPPPPPPVVVAADDPLTQAVTDATKDFTTVTAAVADGVVTLTGEIKRRELPKLMKGLNSLKPRKIENKLTIK